MRVKLLVVGLVSLFGGVALALFVGEERVSDSAFIPFQGSGAGDDSESMMAIESRIVALEDALIAEQNARQLLEEELFRLMDSSETAGDGPEELSEQEAAAVQARRENRRAEMRSRNSRERRTGRLLKAGFDATTAEWILTRESEFQMEMLRARYDANRNGERIDSYQQNSAFRDEMQQQLGDEKFEQYLAANGNPLHVSIGTVLDSSPAQVAGLRPGDQIVNYGGERIYSMRDLTEQTMQGVPDENVVIDFVRDGVPMQVVLPRGPVGITGGR